MAQMAGSSNRVLVIFTNLSGSWPAGHVL